MKQNSQHKRKVNSRGWKRCLLRMWYFCSLLVQCFAMENMVVPMSV